MVLTGNVSIKRTTFDLKSVELQKEMMQMQQQLKAHKENILEVEKNLEEKNYEIASYREKVPPHFKVLGTISLQSNASPYRTEENIF